MGLCRLRAADAQVPQLPLRIRFLIASPPVRDLLLFAKHLFVAARLAISGRSRVARHGVARFGGRA
jgi:hypothetical protein